MNDGRCILKVGSFSAKVGAAGASVGPINVKVGRAVVKVGASVGKVGSVVVKDGCAVVKVGTSVGKDGASDLSKAGWRMIGRSWLAAKREQFGGLSEALIHDGKTGYSGDIPGVVRG